MMNALLFRPTITGLQITTALAEMAAARRNVVNHKFLFKLTDVLDYVTHKLEGIYTTREITKFLLNWKPNEERVSFFNSGLEGKYFFYVRVKDVAMYERAAIFDKDKNKETEVIENGK